VKVSLVVAMSRDGLIGRGGGLPWRLPRDLKHFRRLTWGKPIVMGRRTHESIGRPLPGRTNIVLSRREDYAAEGCLVARDREEALGLAATTGADEAMVIGGCEVFRDFLPLASALHATVVKGEFTGDVFFPVPVLDSPEWTVAHEESWPDDAENPHPSRYVVLVPSRGESIAAGGALKR
jgi:dihydrofolate reductase